MYRCGKIRDPKMIRKLGFTRQPLFPPQTDLPHACLSLPIRMSRIKLSLINGVCVKTVCEQKTGRRFARLPHLAPLFLAGCVWEKPVCLFAVKRCAHLYLCQVHCEKNI